MPKIIKVKTTRETLTIRDFHGKKDKLLIYRQQGGLGDILMHRMLFEDLKNVNPKMHITFACPAMLMDAIKDHPFIDKVVPVENLNTNNFMSYNTSHACTRYETFKAPYSDKHRSDIWAKHCGIELKNHKMHVNLTKDEIEYGKWAIKTIKNGSGPTIVFCPISAMATKNLQDHQMTDVIQGLRDLGLFVFSLHRTPIEHLSNMLVPVIVGQTIRQWMAIIAAADYVLSVDTAAFHFAGGIYKPVTGVYTWADGYVYGKYYPTANIVQFHRETHKDWTCGPCYTWTSCKMTRDSLKPCLTKLTGSMILDGVKKMLDNYPEGT